MWCGSGVYGGGRRYVSLSVAQFAFFYVHVFCVFLCVSERLMPPDALTSHHHRPWAPDSFLLHGLLSLSLSLSLLLAPYRSLSLSLSLSLSFARALSL
jgi:hypothetical protein